MTTVNISTATGDLYGRAVGPVLDNSGGTIELGKIASDPCKAWIPFVVPLLNSTVLVSATLKLVANTSRSGTTGKLRFGCVAVDDASAPGTWAALNALTMTTAYTDDDSVAAQTAGVEYTWNITTAVQEIINRAGWASGNTIGVLIFENGGDNATQRTLASYDNETYTEPILSIDYYSGGQYILWSNE